MWHTPKRNRRALRVEPDFEQRWPGAECSATEVIINLGQAGERVGALVARTVRRYGIPSSTALIVLEILEGAGSALTPSEIAARSFVTRPTLSGVFDTLQRRGLISRTADTRDKRSARLSITADGQDVLKRALTTLHQAEAGWCRDLSTAERAAVIQALARIPNESGDGSTESPIAGA
jgi:DNA-binding MarR family transcriptional regulator